MADDGLVRFHCTKCNKRLKARTEHAGRMVACSQCGTAVVVPTPDVQDSDLIGLPGFGEPPPPPWGAIPPMPPLPSGPPPGEIACPHCSTTLADDPTMSGSVVTCPRCGQPFQMPMPRRLPVQPFVHRSVSEVRIGSAYRPSGTFAQFFAGSMGSSMGWILGVFAALLLIFALICGGCLAIAIIGGSATQQENTKQVKHRP